MAERKVLNKYFPPDFDPALIPRRKQPKDLQHKVRLMTPFSMRCNTCGEYIYKGKKFNARKETTEETYHSIKIFRFYIRCNRCAAEITFKTDPANSDYVAEHGAQRNFEPWRGDDSAGAEKEEEEENNPMKALENRTQDSKREMEIMDALDEIRTRNAVNERVDADTLLNRIVGTEEEIALKQQQLEDEEDDRLAKAVFKDADGETVKRLHDDLDGSDEEPDVAKIAMAKFSQPLTLPDFSTPLAKKRKQGGSLGLVKSATTTTSALGLGTILVKPATSTITPPTSTPKATSSSSASSAAAPSSSTSKPAAKPASLLSLVGSYGSDSDSDSE
ncbi:hypothetical protein BG015_000560 [Linnemannia schmuckeri]|uniref:Splicing factor YJU2 n=1 Tax=Linnemannia schmuckeri TaxID=64567 RepID=A0A9P5S4C9_9FUNG|nr:hypothetical protein BG015_000560 [Linnemannia schmuckeri]